VSLTNFADPCLCLHCIDTVGWVAAWASLHSSIIECFDALFGWEEGHPAHKTTHFNSPYYQGCN